MIKNWQYNSKYVDFQVVSKKSTWKLICQRKNQQKRCRFVMGQERLVIFRLVIDNKGSKFDKISSQCQKTVSRFLPRRAQSNLYLSSIEIQRIDDSSLLRMLEGNIGHFKTRLPAHCKGDRKKILQLKFQVYIAKQYCEKFSGRNQN